MTISAIIVTYNNSQTITDCLQSLLKVSNGLVSEIFIIDNNSQDDTLNKVRAMFTPSQIPTKIFIQKNNENLGFGRAVNQGLDRAQGGLVLLLNPDAVIDGGLPAMVNYLANNKKIGLVGPWFVSGNGQVQPSFGRLPNFLRAFCHLTKLEKILPGGFYQADNYWNRNKFKSSHQVDWLGGGCWLIKKEVLKTVGYFDENFFMYLEDVDYCVRIKKAGWLVHYFPNATVKHLLGHSFQGVARKTKYDILRNSWRFYWQKHYPGRKLEQLAIRVIFGLKEMIRKYGK